jgi:hypothetical protein
MTTTVELSVGLLRRFADFTKKLSPEQLAAVVSGELKFGLLDQAGKKKSALPVDAAQLSAELAAMPSREAAAARLDGLNLSAPMMKDLAKAMGASISGVTRKDAFRDRIVEHTLGFRLNSQTIRSGSWSS